MPDPIPTYGDEVAPRAFGPGDYTVQRLILPNPYDKRRYSELNALFKLLSPGDHHVSPDTLERAFRRGSAVLIALTPDGSIVGVATLAVKWLAHGSKLSVEDVAVLPSHRRRGIGTKMMLAAVMTVRQVGCDKLYLSSNDPAVQKLLAQIGFEVHAENMCINPLEIDQSRFNTEGILV